MKIKKLYIRDFGVYNNATLEELSPGIVVLGGKNRAGKSTLLKILRYLPFGYQKSYDLPPAKIEYEVDGEIESATKELLNINVKGYGNPVISGSKNGVNPFGDVDVFTYKQLFTISLDELQNLGEQEEKLQAVLLGAGLKDIVKVPSLVTEFKKEAEKIGGRNGNPKTKLFKPAWNKINEGLCIRENSLKQLDNYSNSIDKLKVIESNIDVLQREMKESEERLNLLDALRINHKLYKEMQELKIKKALIEAEGLYKDEKLSLQLIESLKAEYIKVLEEYNKDKKIFIINAGAGEEIFEDFNLYRENLKRSSVNVASISEKIKNYKSLLEKCKKSKQDIILDIIDINEAWKEDFSYILNINTEEISFGRLNEAIEAFKASSKNIDEVKNKISELLSQKKLLETEVKNKIINPIKLFIFYLISALCIIIAGAIIYSQNKGFGLIFSCFGIGGVLILSLSKMLLSKNTVLGNSKLKDIEIELKTKKIELNDKISTFNRDNESIIAYKRMLSLEDSVPIDSMKDYFRLVREIKKRILELKFNLEVLSSTEKEINIDLSELNKLCIQFKKVLGYDETKVTKNMLLYYEYIFKCIEDLNFKYSFYENLRVSNNAKINLEGRICSLISCDATNILNEIDRKCTELIKLKQFEKIEADYLNLSTQLMHSVKNEKLLKILVNNDETRSISDEEILLCLKVHMEQFLGESDLIREYEQEQEKFKNKVLELEALKENRVKLKEEIKRIYENEDIKESQRQIDNGRRELKVLGEKYAVYSAAAFILESLQKNFIEKSKDSLLSGAGKILNEITSGEYQAILPQDDLRICDFKTVKADGMVNESSEILSRGTKEQLFLAVRLSRIKEIKWKMPIIIDDSLVNFDSSHLRRIIKILKELSKENQIFILTCHPEVVELVNEIDDTAGFYKIEAGKFNKVKGRELEKYLS